MNLIPFGMWHPDAAQINAPVVIEARNCIPGVSSFLPLPSPVPSTATVGSPVRGAVSVLRDDGTVTTFAGTQTDLFKLAADTSWTNVTRLSGGSYSVGTGEQWKFAAYGDNFIAANVNAPLQQISITTGTNFAPISSSPQARYITIMREFVLVGAIYGNEKRIQWSGNGLSDSWTPSVNESDYQDLPDGGPVRGLIGGEVAYIFQASRVTRMTYVPGSSYIMQLDQIEGAAGLAAPHSLVRLRSEAYYLAPDGIRKMDLAGASSVPIGVGKWAKWFLGDLKAGSEISVIGAANPVRPQIVWAYISRSNATAIPDRLLIYDWSLDEATFADVPVESIMQWLSSGITLDSMNGYGTLDTLPFSLDSPFWKGGASIIGVFSTDHKLSILSGTPLAAAWTTGDGQAPSRVFVKGTRPRIDASGVTIAIAARERQSDAVSFGNYESMEDTGDVPAHVSGNIIRARITVPSQTWTQIEGIDTDAGKRGNR